MFGILVGAAPATHNAKPNFDSGKSSDSSLSSSYRHGHEGGSLRMDQRSKTDNTYVKNFAQPTILSTRCFFWQHNKFTIRRARILHILFQLSKNSGEFQFAQYSARSTVFDRCENPVAIVFGVECHGRWQFFGSTFVKHTAIQEETAWRQASRKHFTRRHYQRSHCKAPKFRL